jgi:hypothetical protein
MVRKRSDGAVSSGLVLCSVGDGGSPGGRRLTGLSFSGQSVVCASMTLAKMCPVEVSEEVNRNDERKTGREWKEGYVRAKFLKTKCASNK